MAEMTKNIKADKWGLSNLGTVWSKGSGLHKEATEGGLCEHQRGDPRDREVLRAQRRSYEEVLRTKRSKGQGMRLIKCMGSYRLV